MSRSWRVQPCERSTETLAPPLVVASMAPYSAIETMMNAVTLPLPTDCVLYASAVPKMRKNTGGMISVKITVRRLRSRRRSSIARNGPLTRPVRGRPVGGAWPVGGGGGAHAVAPGVSWSPVRARNASSSPRAVISMSLAAVAVSR